ncbi:MAG: glycosyltransferase family 10 [Planctomycetota bacterium]|nr:glycosyltransferase family 10 [Planctomycetota bacterium]
MATILLTTSVPTEPVLRQVPRAVPNWCNHEFVKECSEERIVDAWFVYDNLLKPETHRVDRRKTMLITGEPPSIRRYRSVFTSQFGAVRTSHSAIEHPQIIRGHEAQVWHFGMHSCRTHPEILDYDTLANMSRPKKTKLLSVISSNKAITEDHRQRLRFVDALKKAFGDQIDVFGRGIRDVPDKADAIWDYKYHIVLENDHSELYMSEKLPDGFLGWTFPFYSGSTHADKSFPEGSFARIDMYDPVRSIETIRSHVQSNSYETSIEQLEKARKIVLDELNLFAVLCKTYDAMEASLSSQKRLAQNTVRPLTLIPKKNSVQLSMKRIMRALSLTQ